MKRTDSSSTEIRVPFGGWNSRICAPRRSDRRFARGRRLISDLRSSPSALSPFLRPRSSSLGVVPRKWSVITATQARRDEANILSLSLSLPLRPPAPPPPLVHRASSSNREKLISSLARCSRRAQDRYCEKICRRNATSITTFAFLAFYAISYNSSYYALRARARFPHISRSGGILCAAERIDVQISACRRL